MEQLNIIEPQIIEAQTGTELILKKGECLKIIDIEGQQVCDLACYNLHDNKEYLSSGRSIDYAENIYLTKGDKFYSNYSNVMFEIIEDKVGRHDFLLTPCSAKMFELAYGETEFRPGCFENLCSSLKKYEINDNNVHTTFNIFMNVEVVKNGKILISPPKSLAGDYIIIKAQMDLIVGLTACSDKLTNGGRLKKIGFIKI